MNKRRMTKMTRRIISDLTLKLVLGLSVVLAVSGYIVQKRNQTNYGIIAITGVIQVLMFTVFGVISARIFENRMGRVIFWGAVVAAIGKGLEIMLRLFPI